MALIYFIYFIKKGSTEMRCFQVGKLLSEKHEIKYIYHTENKNEIYNIKNSIIFLFKCLEKMEDIDFQMIKNNNNKIIFDTIDFTHKSKKLANFEKNDIYNNFDLIITPLIGLYNMNIDLKKVMYVPHHYDIKFDNLKFPETKINRVLYNGSVCYLGRYHNLLKNVEICDSFSEFMKKIDYYLKFQYQISFYDNNVVDSYNKPITKVATSAACNTIIICENSEENIHWLGKDYPFYIDMNDKEKSINDWMDQIERNVVRKKDKRIAMDKMKELREELKLKNIIDKYYRKIFKTI